MTPWRLTILSLAIVTIAGGASASPPPTADDANTLEFHARLERISVRQLDEAMDLVQWAVEKDLLDEADQLCRAILRQDPDHEDAWYALRSIGSTRLPTRESDALARASAELPESFREYETRRYVILSDADRGWIRIQSDRLDRAHDEFFQFAVELGLRPLPLRHKLVAVVFEDRADFATLARRDGIGSVHRVAGYYSPPRDRLVFYHVESEANIHAARSELEALYEEAEAARREARRAGMLGRRAEANEMRETLDRRLAHLDERERAINVVAHRRSVAVTVHEAIHQLMFHTGVQSPRIEHPRWLSEGLATCFETDNPNRPFGPLRDYYVRRERFWQLLDGDRLVPLRELVTTSSTRADARMVDAAYHQGYALISRMCRSRKIELRRYLQALNALPPGPVAPDVHMRVFTESFGDIERLERTWLAYERR